MSCKSKWWIRVKHIERGHSKVDHEFTCKWCKLVHVQNMTSYRAKNNPPNFCSYSCRSLWQAENKVGTAGKTNKERFDEYIHKFGEEQARKEWKKFRRKVWNKKNFAKGNATKVQRGNYKTSSHEKIAESILREHFEKVEVQVSIKRWFMDFRVNDQVYVQVDGVYWHGLDRPLDVIRNSGGALDKRIAEGFQKDRKQDKFFKENQMKLVRVTDVEMEKDPYIVVERVKNELV